MNAPRGRRPRVAGAPNSAARGNHQSQAWSSAQQFLEGKSWWVSSRKSIVTPHDRTLKDHCFSTVWLFYSFLGVTICTGCKTMKLTGLAWFAHGDPRTCCCPADRCVKVHCGCDVPMGHHGVSFWALRAEPSKGSLNNGKLSDFAGAKKNRNTAPYIAI